MLDGAAIAAWVSVVFGTLFGLLLVLMSGAGKLLPFHPMYTKLQPGFEKMMGPFFGLPGDALRIFIGLSEVAAGAGFLVGVWATQLGLVNADLKVLANALLISDAVAIASLFAGATWYHVAVEGSPGACPVFILFAVIIGGTRLVVTPFASFSAHYQTIIGAISVASILALIMSVAARSAAGESIASLQKKHGEMKEAEKRLAE